MQNSYKIIVILLLASQAVLAEPKQLTNFIQILDALKAGYNVNAVINYKECKIVSEGSTVKSPDQLGGMDLKPFDYYAAGVILPKAFISASETNMIFLGGGGGYFYNYTKLRVYDDNTVEITVRYLSIDKLEAQTDQTFLGEINDGSNGKAVSFFVE